MHCKEPHSPFSLPKGQDSRDSNRVGQVLKRHFIATLSQPINITKSSNHCRHQPLLSRESTCLRAGSIATTALKRQLERQSSHSIWTAGTIYAQGVEEASGQVTERRAAYRSISKELYRFLSFAPALLPALRQPLPHITGAPLQKKKEKRPATEQGGSQRFGKRGHIRK